MRNPIARLFGFGRGQLSSPLSDRYELQAATFAHLTGVDLESISVSRSDAMSVAALARGRNVIAPTIARLPLITMTGTDEAAPAGIIEKPEAGRPRYQTLLWSVDAMIFYGRAWWLITERYAEDGRPRRVQWVPEWEVQLDSHGNMIAAFNSPVKAVDVIRIDGPHEGILNFAAPRIRAALRIDRAALNASDNPVPSVELHQTEGTPLTNDEASELVATYAAQRKRSGVSYTSKNVETRTHGAQPEQLLISGRGASALDIARILNLPAWAVDAPAEGNSMTYSNVPSRARELLDYTLAPYMEAICARLSEDDVLPRGTWCRFDADSLTAEDFKTRMESYKSAQDAGIYTADELRARERGVPLETKD